jgi:peptidoglycan/xylan/chitin deacetylase (PgdA/CDA1 family)
MGFHSNVKVQAALGLARPTGLAAITRAATRRQLRILCYHGLWVTPGVPFGNCTFIDPAQFESRMRRLKRSGHPVVPLGEAVARLAADDLPDAAVVITIDDGWASTFTHMLAVLEALELPATLYAATWYSQHRLPVVNVAVDYLRTAAGRPDIDVTAQIAAIEALPLGERLAALRALGQQLGVSEAWLETRQFEFMTAGELAEAHRRGLDIQLHTHRHVEIADGLDRLAQEIADNRAFLSAALPGARFEHFCFPSGSFHPGAGAILAAHGVVTATLCDQGLNAADADPLALRRLLDGRDVSDEQFDAYLSGVLHFVGRLRG